MVIEVDAAVWRRQDPTDSIVISAKTRLKEVFHIGTMWKILFDMIGDAHSLGKWGLTSGPALPNMTYVFATADVSAEVTVFDGQSLARLIRDERVWLVDPATEQVMRMNPHLSDVHLNDLYWQHAGWIPIS